MPRNAAGAIARLRCELTQVDKNPLREAPTCECNQKLSSSRHVILECPKWTTERTRLLKGQKGTATWDSITNTNIRPKELLQFLAEVGIIHARKIVLSYEDARAEDYELGADI
ncbi:hypothetical protein Q9L58_010503 [Maublancomyces gigas]|uniref:Reverse transcriptase n=1 Tax=Discina gigas TaxID=1032678 RepID=A0ABR3G459_9PEZI